VSARPVVVLLALALAPCLLAACGGPITNDELQRGVQTLGATSSPSR
jgi:outer membrane murein-binding lipoprotein Lpp